MNTKECFTLIETKFPHLFTFDQGNNSITLKSGFGNIPPFTLVCVEGGEFEMGSNEIDIEEMPPHRVKLSSFFIAEFQVTQELYKNVTNQNPSLFHGLNHPVEQVSWYDAIQFCNQINSLLKLPLPYSGKLKIKKCDFQCSTFRLPTEAEYEYAANGGVSEYNPKDTKNDREKVITHISSRMKDHYKYSGGNQPNDVGWYDNNNQYETKPVGLKFPNKLGIYDMSGNVWEWCWDKYESTYYSLCNQIGLVANPTGATNSSSRISRGGSWHGDAVDCRVVCRNYNSPSFKWSSGGFRLVFALLDPIDIPID